MFVFVHVRMCVYWPVHTYILYIPAPYVRIRTCTYIHTHTQSHTHTHHHTHACLQSLASSQRKEDALQGELEAAQQLLQQETQQLRGERDAKVRMLPLTLASIGDFLTT